MSASTNIEWTDASWPVVAGCVKLSAGCTHCWAIRDAWRLSHNPNRAVREVYAGTATKTPGGALNWTGAVKPQPQRLDWPLRWRKPKKIFVCNQSDLFHEKVSDEFIDRVFDVIWQTPQHTYQVLTKRADRAVEYMRRRAWRRRHGWIDTDQQPMSPGEIIHYDDIVMRNMCGYLGEGHYACDHPSKGTERGVDKSCSAWECPIASTVDDRPTLEEVGVADEYTYDAEGYAEDCEWMRLHGRPRHAQPGNLWLGFSAENQETFEQREAAFRRLRDGNPYLTLFCSMEPLLGPIAAKLDHYKCNGPDALRVPYLNWVIVGSESGPRARPCDLDWVRSLRDQCTAAGVAFFWKQHVEHGRKLSLPHLDGRQWTEFPAGARVTEKGR